MDLKIHGPLHPSTSIIKGNLGLAWHALGNYAKAVEYYEAVLNSIDENSIGMKHPRIKKIKKALREARAKL